MLELTLLSSAVSKLVTSKGEILIPGIKEMVAPLTDEERARYEAIHAEVSDFDDAVGAAITLHDDKVNTVSAGTIVRRVVCGFG
jgi:Cys-Gly metallodipeptidase DUG1